MTGSRKLVLIGICSGDRDLIVNWAGAGLLPHLNGLLSSGLVAHTEGLPGVYVGAHWPSFNTGSLPTFNRVHSWEQIRPGTYDMYRCRAGDHNQRPQFWEALSAAGKRVCVLDIPHSRLSRNLNGIQTVEWGAHDAAYGFTASSSALKKEIINTYGIHPVSGHSDKERRPEELNAFADDLVRGAEMKGRLSEDFVQREDWDFFAQVFTEAHCGGHLLWHLHDTAHPRHGEAAHLGDRLLDVYQAIDAGIGRILRQLDDETTVMVVANHGIQPKYAPQFMLQEMLIAMGLARPAGRRPSAPTLADRIDPYVTRTWQALPQSLRNLLMPVRAQFRPVDYQEVVPPPKVNRAESLCFPVQNNTAHGGLRLNLKGREPNGKINPGADYENFLDEVTREFMSIVNCDTGRPIVKRVHRADALYAGPERDHFPDLMIEWANDEPLHAISSNRMGRMEVNYTLCRTGEHRPAGMVLVKGPGIQPAKLQRTLTCIDIAPTIGAMLGVDLPQVDGVPVREFVGAAETV